MMRVLFATSEAYPLLKTGGLGDVAGSLPAALRELRQDVRLILPAYPEAVARAGAVHVAAELDLPQGRVRLLAGELPGKGVPVWLVDYPPFFARPGNPYLGPDALPWHDNADRFALFARVAAQVALGRAGVDWRADVVHANDWQGALLPAFLAQETPRPATVFTVHNLAYQGLFPYSTFVALDLPSAWWHFSACEFHGQFSFIKGGLVFADHITTVSPTYAREIQTPELGFGLDGLLRHRAPQLSGILNGIDTQEWNPAHDPHLAQSYSGRNLVAGKAANKRAVLSAFGLPPRADWPLFGLVGRLVQQKGIDQVLEALPVLSALPLQMVLLGTGEPHYQAALQDWAARYPERLGVRIGFDEGAAHRVEAGADAFLMPSRFEPCGLNQMYSLRYGTLPVVRAVGGLADTVVDATPENLAAGTATGVTFVGTALEDLIGAVKRTLDVYQQRTQWRQLQRTAMRQDFSWRRSAQQYLELYRRLAEGAKPTAPHA